MTWLTVEVVQEATGFATYMGLSCPGKTTTTVIISGSTVLEFLVCFSSISLLDSEEQGFSKEQKRMTKAQAMSAKRKPRPQYIYGIGEFHCQKPGLAIQEPE